jgi:glucosamine-6-phosphate deaminase
VHIKICDNNLGTIAAQHAANSIRNALASHSTARITFATGASQFDFLGCLTSLAEIDWTRVEMFHLDEYIGLPESHPASFRKYLRERILNKVPISRYHLLDVDRGPDTIIREVSEAILSAPIDLAIVGIGENGHLAFNDPPADFDTEAPYIVVALDEACRQQQVGEGWFANMTEVPAQAISMSIRQIMRSREVICIAPEARKAPAVKATLEGEITPQVPASILRNHPNVTIYLDQDSAALLTSHT